MEGGVPKEAGNTSEGEDGAPKPAGALSPAVLMEAVKQLTDQMLKDNDVFADITGISVGCRSSRGDSSEEEGPVELLNTFTAINGAIRV